MFLNRKASEVPDEQAMRQVMSLLDEWEAPEPSPWFDGRMMARFREEQTRAPESLLQRLRDRWLFARYGSMKPLMVGAMALLIMAGSGSYWELNQHRLQPGNVSATVEDLQVLDSNEQAIQQMDQLLDDNDDAAPQS